jgi:hypothetical protein
LHAGTFSNLSSIAVIVMQAIYKSRKDPQAAVKAKKDAERIMFQLDTDKNKKLSEAEFVQAATSCPEVLEILHGN